MGQSGEGEIRGEVAPCARDYCDRDLGHRGDLSQRRPEREVPVEVEGIELFGGVEGDRCDVLRMRELAMVEFGPARCGTLVTESSTGAMATVGCSATD